jgi:hypothetical protein
MAGLLDAFLNMTPEQNKGLMAAATKMLDMSAPSRVPRNIMQVAAHGMNAFHDGIQDERDRKTVEQQRAMQQQFLDWKIKDAEADFGHQQGVRERDTRIAGRVRKLYEGGQDLNLGALEGVPGAAPDFTGNLSSTPAFTPDPRLGLGGAMGGAGDIQSLLGNFNSRPPGAVPGGSNSYGQGGASSAMGGAPGMPRAAPGGQPPAGPQGAEWLSMGLPPEFALSMMQGGRGKPNRTQQHVERLMGEAEIYASEGDFENADKRYKSASGLMPQVERIEMATDPQTNKPVRVITYKDGREEVSAFGAKRDMVDIDLGGARKFVDRNQVQPGDEYRKTQSPDSAAADTRFARRLSGGGGGAGAEPSLDDDTLEFLADRALRGDRTALQNLGRGGQGAANLVAVNQRVAQKAKAQGLTGGDLASINADYQGQVAGLRTSGTISARIENAAAEAAELAPLALAASEKVARSGLLPFGRAEMMFNKNTNSPAMNEFATANIGLATAYAGAMARGGKSTVADMEHAREILSTAKNHEAYKAIVGQINLEIQAAQRAPQRVRNHLRTEISGRGGDHGGGEPGGPSAAKPVISLADITETARTSKRTTREVTAAFRAKGYKIQGDK